MSRALLRQTLASLPYALREQVDGYTAFIEENATGIFATMVVPPDARTREEFIYFAGLRRLWRLVDSQFWLVDRSLALGGRVGISGVVAGSSHFARGAGQYEDLRRLRDNFFAEATRLGIAELVAARSVEDMLARLMERRGGESR